MSTHPSPRAPGHRHDGGAGPHPESSTTPSASVPLLDPTVLQDMEQDFADSRVVARFARDFSVSLDDKIDRLDARLQDRDAPGADQAVVSLSTSAAMVGACCLGEAARAARDSLTADSAGSMRAVAELRACAADTIRELELTYPRSA